MDILNTLLEEHSKAQMTRIVNYVGHEKERVEELLDIFLNPPDGSIRIQQRAAWPLSYIGEKNPMLIMPYTEQLFSLLDKKVSDTVKRNVLRAYRHTPISVEYHDIVVDKCFLLIQNIEEAGAIHAFAIDIVGKILIHYPELAEELRLIIEERYEHEKPAFKFVAKRTLKLLKK